ncbi:hypothetical protein [Hyalangium sp.]|uniref:hypothetical protein n=1 Tax=Hyalangium sp. TaxID=2028555 RepID=UPI002D6808FA|nr:hypothetical protein [Hyalangium sp.]HYH98461.1 hypothetical protein [Hyalangium sp.]
MEQDKDKTPTPNDQRSTVKNPTSPEYKADRENRSDQMNPNNPAHPTSPKQVKKG